MHQVLERQTYAEQKLIACHYYDPENTIRECGWVKPAHFTDPRRAEYWRLILAGATPQNAAIEAGNYEEVFDWAVGVDNFRDAPAFAAMLDKEGWLVQQMRDALRLIAAAATGDDQAVWEIGRGLAGHIRAGAGKAPTAVEVGLALVDMLKNRSLVIPSGMPDYDEVLGGYSRKSLTVLAARPAMGKTAWAWQDAREIAARRKEKVMFFSLEMSAPVMWGRSVALKAGYDWLKVKRGTYSDEKLQGLIDYIVKQEIPRYDERLIIIDEPQTIGGIWQWAGQERPDVVYVDHLRLIGGLADKDEVERLGDLTWQLKSMAKALNLHVILLVQLNRGLASRMDKTPMMTDLRGSGMIEENADTVLFLHADDYYKAGKPLPPQGEVDLVVGKHREGAAGMGIAYLFDREMQLFKPLVRDR